MPVAIIGMACRFPGAPSKEAYWQMLLNGECGISDVPQGRWDKDALYDADPKTPFRMVTRKGGFVDGIENFDPEFWKIQPREAEFMDPQHRMLLQTTWHGLEDAGISREELKGSSTGVFVGLSSYDYGRLLSDGKGDPYAAYCSAFCIASNRLSYLLDVNGPSFTLDTACSSGLLGMHLAAKSIERGECTQAIVSSANAILKTDLMTSLSSAGMLSPDGLCKPFDAGANGYGRSEGVATLILKDLEKAQADGDRIYALVLGSATNQDGLSNGLTAPNPSAQKAVLKQAYADANIPLDSVGYIEAHGTGTPLGDPIETGALSAILCQNRSVEAQLKIGSNKGNIGHTEPVAGLASVIKGALSLQNGYIPGTINHHQLNPRIDEAKSKVSVVTETIPWPSYGPNMGVSAFGYGGSNVHAVLGPAPTPEEILPSSKNSLGHLLLLSARSEDALHRLAGLVAEQLEQHPEAVDHIVKTAARRRTQDKHRLVLSANSAEALSESLWSWKENPASGAAFSSKQIATRPKVTWVFSGNGSQWPAMGAELYRQEPLFAKTIDECDAFTRELAGWSLTEYLTKESDEERPSIIHPLIFAIQAGLCDWFKAIGWMPAHVIGHSLGEVAAAYCTGALTLRDAMKVVLARGAALDSCLGKGAMLAVECERDKLTQWIEAASSDSSQVEIATHNGLGSWVLAGDAKDLQKIRDWAASEDIWHRAVNVPLAYHSAAVEEAAEQLEADLQDLVFSKPTISWISTVEPEQEVWTADAAYWKKNLRQTVRFYEATNAAIEKKTHIFLEITPHPVLRHSIKKSIEATESKAQVVTTMQKPANNPGMNPLTSQALLRQQIGNMWAQGIPTDLKELFEAPSRVHPLPPYPFEEKPFWFRPEDAQQHNNTQHPIFNAELSPFDTPQKRYFSGTVSAKADSAYLDHQLQKTPVLPATVFLDACLHALKTLEEDKNWIVKEVRFTRAIVLSEEEDTQLQLVLDSSDQSISFFAKDPEDDQHRLCATAGFGLGEKINEQFDIQALQSELAPIESTEQLYAEMGQRGYDYGLAFQGLSRVFQGEKTAFATLQHSFPVIRDGDRHCIHPALFDAALQSLAATLKGESLTELVVPAQFGKIIRGNENTVHSVYAVCTSFEEGRLKGELSLLDRNGQVAYTLKEVELAPLSGPLQARTDWVHEITWEQLEDELSGEITPHTLAVVGFQNALMGSLMEALKTKVEDVTAFEIGQPYDSSLAEYDHVLFVGNLETDVENPSDLRFQASAEEAFVQQVFAFTKRLALAEKSPRWSYVSFSTQPVQSDDPIHLSGSSLWGLGRTLTYEQPTMMARCVDVPFPGTGSKLTWDAVAQACLWQGNEDQFALRVSENEELTLYGARITRGSLPRQNAKIEGSHGAVLITGGLGALGLRAAKLAGTLGATHVVLWGRRAPNELAQGVIDKLSNAGTKVLVQSVDVSDYDSVSQAVQACQSTFAPISGVLHAAGLVDNATVDVLSMESVLRTMKPKISGSVNLLEALKDQSIDFFVTYGSLSASLGSPGQANYSVANAWLETLAFVMRDRKIPYTNIAWGAWEEKGLAANDEHWSERVRASGFGLIPVEEGDELLARLLNKGPIARTIVPISVENLKKVLGEVPPSLLRAIVGESEQNDQFLQQTIDLPSADRKKAIVDYLETWVATALQLSPDQINSEASLADLGLDSLLGLELRSRIEMVFSCKLPSAILASQPSIQIISEVIYEHVSLRSTPEEKKSLEDDIRLLRFGKIEKPRGRIFAFHHAGGRAGNYRMWQNHVAEGIEVCAIDLATPPAALEKLNEPSDLLRTMAGEIVELMQSLVDVPYVLWGHSLGGMLAYEVARQMQQQQLPSAQALVVLGTKAAGRQKTKSPVAFADDTTLITRLQETEGIPDSLLEQPKMLSAFLPRIRRDLHLLESYRYVEGDKIPIPIVAVRGKDDSLVSMEEAKHWQEHTTGMCKAIEIEGHHFPDTETMGSHWSELAQLFE